MKLSTSANILHRSQYSSELIANVCFFLFDSIIVYAQHNTTMMECGWNLSCFAVSRKWKAFTITQRKNVGKYKCWTAPSKSDATQWTEQCILTEEECCLRTAAAVTENAPIENWNHIHISVHATLAAAAASAVIVTAFWLRSCKNIHKTHDKEVTHDRLRQRTILSGWNEKHQFNSLFILRFKLGYWSKRKILYACTRKTYCTMCIFRANFYTYVHGTFIIWLHEMRAFEIQDRHAHHIETTMLMMLSLLRMISAEAETNTPSTCFVWCM